MSVELYEVRHLAAIVVPCLTLLAELAIVAGNLRCMWSKWIDHWDQVDFRRRYHRELKRQLRSFLASDTKHRTLTNIKGKTWPLCSPDFWKSPSRPGCWLSQGESSCRPGRNSAPSQVTSSDAATAPVVKDPM